MLFNRNKDYGYDAHNELKTIDENLDVAMDRVAAKYQS